MGTTALHDGESEELGSTLLIPHLQAAPGVAGLTQVIKCADVHPEMGVALLANVMKMFEMYETLAHSASKPLNPPAHIYCVCFLLLHLEI